MEIIILLVVAAAVGIALRFVSAREKRRQALVANGTAVEGRILSGRRVKTRSGYQNGHHYKKEGYTQWRIFYKVDGFEYRFERRGVELEEATIREYTGERITVYYDPKDPKFAWAEAPGPKGLGY